MIRKRVLPRALFIIFVVSFTSFLLLNINTVSADFTEKLIVELDKPDAYPSQDVTITISYMATFPSDESYEMEDSIIYMTVTTSGLVADIETTDYLLNQYVGKPVISGYKYKLVS